MARSAVHADPIAAGPQWARWLTAAILMGVLVGQIWVMSRARGAGIEQPVPFSHRVHAGDKGISCQFCHSAVDRSARAGLPPLGTCVMCHQRIVPNLPPIKQLRDAYARGEVLEWVRIVRLPDYARFNHAMHITAGIDCSHCHGNVHEMDRIVNVNRFKMGWCVDCHRERKASTDCSVCHY